MEPRDVNYLILQFKVKVFSIMGIEYQKFFEDIMEKAFLGFQKVRPYGSDGDGGNDGYIKDSGTYYQVFAPRDPYINEAEASGKLKVDFYKLKEKWDDIVKIKKFYFVYNNKYDGSVLQLEKMITNLRGDNPGIEFKLFLTKDLEKVFLKLGDAEILGLGFDINRRRAISNAYSYLEIIQTELDRENIKSAQRILEPIEIIVSELNDENLEIEYKILKCKYLQKLEKIEEVKNSYNSISRQYPNDPRAFLYLAELCLLDNDLEKNRELLEEAERIDPDFWLLRLEQLITKLRVGEKFSIEDIDEINFPEGRRERASFFRLNSLVFEILNDPTNADRFIEKAIQINPEKLENYLDQLLLIEIRICNNNNNSEEIKLSEDLLEKISEIEKKFLISDEMGARIRANLNIKKLTRAEVLQNSDEINSIIKETFELTLTCYFDKDIEQVFKRLIHAYPLSDNDLIKLLDYLEKSKNTISDDFSKILIVQFNLKNSLFTQGKKFFENIKKERFVNFISDLENKEYEKVLTFLDDDIRFSIILIKTLNNYFDLREKIIESLPDDKGIQKDIFYLFLKYEKKEFDEAFQILKKIDLSPLSNIELRFLLPIVQKNDAWDYELIILEKLLENEHDMKEILNLNLELFNANINLKKYQDVINIGERMLGNDYEHLLSPTQKEAILTNTIFACFERGKINDATYRKAKYLLLKYPLEKPSFEFSIGVEAEVYFVNKEVQEALNAIIKGVKNKKILTPDDYVRLYFSFLLKIGSEISINLESAEKVTEETFVKLSNNDRWFFIGDGNALDANKISRDHNKYSSFINKMIGTSVELGSKYSTQYSEVIEFIFSIDQYILWQSQLAFQNQGKAGLLEGVYIIEMSEQEGSVDTKKLLSFMEDSNKKAEEFFEIYANNTIPLAMLAVSEGGLINAIGRIGQEDKGFIHFSNGTVSDFDRQKEIAKTVLNGKLPFYIDGTSALFLSQIGMFPKIYSYITDFKVPQSVINLLASVADRFCYMPGQKGFMGYSNGQMFFSPVDKEKSDLIRSNIINSIQLLESDPRNIKVISDVNKVNCFSEIKVPSELNDACILAQQDNLPLMTEDYLYIQMNINETKKSPPVYFSSLALIRVLYEEGFVNFIDYLEYFCYLSSYRFRFLSIRSDDLKKAVFGDGKIKYVEPNNIRKFNFPLTLSETYGVSLQNAVTIIGRFLSELLTDDTVTEEMTERIFIEILNSFPTEIGKNNLGLFFLDVCIKVVRNTISNSLTSINNQILKKKVERLLNLTDIYNLNLCIPNKF